MAEFIFKKMTEEKGISSQFVVASCATSTEEIIGGVGNPVYPPAREELALHGISCEGKRAVRLEKGDYEKYDLFLCMDENNMRNIRRIFPSDPENKVHKFLEYTGVGGNVADPWYTGDFERTYKDITAGCMVLIEEIK